MMVNISKNNLSLKSKYSFLAKVFNDLAKLSSLKSGKPKQQKQTTKQKKWIFDLPEAKITKMDPKYDPTNLALEDNIHREWFIEESHHSTVKGDEE